MPSVAPAAWDCTELTTTEHTSAYADTHMHMCAWTHACPIFFFIKRLQVLVPHGRWTGEKGRGQNSTFFKENMETKVNMKKWGKTVPELRKGANQYILFLLKKKKP